MENVYLLQPNFRQPYYAASDDQFVEGCYFVPYSIGSLWAYVSSFADINTSYDLKGLIFKREPFNQLLKMMEAPNGKPNVIGFSNYTWNWEYNITAAKFLKKHFPDSLIIFGGPRVPDRMENFFKDHPFIDITVHAEGEYTFRNILRENMKENPDFSKINGISLNSNGETITAPRQERIENLDELPNPYLAGVFDKIFADNPFIRWNGTIETNRGCPYSCIFCDWGSATYSQVRKFDNDSIKRGLDWCAEHKIEFIHVADANFGIFKQKDSELVDYVIDLKKRTNYPQVFCATWNKNASEKIIEMAAKLTHNGMDRGMTLSVQTMSPLALETVKRKNMGSSNLSKMLELCQKMSVPPYTELILGLPNESLESWKAGISQILELGQHNSLDVWLAQIIENTELNLPEVRELHGIDTILAKKIDQNMESDQDVSESAVLIRATKTLPFEDYIDAYMFAWVVINLHTYGWTQIFARFMHRNNNKSYRYIYEKLHDWIVDKHPMFIEYHYQQTRETITSFLQTGAIDGGRVHSAIGKNILGEAQRHFHLNPQAVWDDLQDFFDGFDGLDKEMFSDLLALQHKFVTNPNHRYPFTLECKSNLFEYLNNPDSTMVDLLPGSTQYQLDLLEPFDDLQDYIGKLYFRRNVGWGKSVVTRV